MSAHSSSVKSSWQFRQIKGFRPLVPSTYPIIHKANTCPRPKLASIGANFQNSLSEAEALGAYHAARDRMVAELFEVTVRLAAHPPADEFIALQRSLSAAIEAEADELAS